MRFSVFVALVVATFVAGCVGFVNAENAVQVDNQVEDSESEVINNDNKVVRRLREGRKLADQWWLTNTDGEERGLSGAKSFLSGLTQKVSSKVPGKTETLSKTEINSMAKGVVTAVKKNPGNWHKIKKGLKIVYGVALTTLVLTAALAMYDLYG